jgi:protocatechuate 3,4-dioxygenase beta subunit
MVFGAEWAAAQAPTAISGRVLDATSQAALTRVRVALVTPDDRSETLFTDDHGVFSIASVPAGAMIRFSKAAYATATLSPGQVAAAVRLTRAVSISGRVLEPSGASFADAQVRVRPIPSPAAGQTAEYTVETNDLGEYRVGGLLEGRYEVAVVRPWQSSPRIVSSTAGDDIAAVDFTVPPFTCQPDPLDRRTRAPGANASIGGRITTTTGAPLACAEVRALRNGEPPHITSTDKEGRFTLSGLTTGSYRIDARAPGYPVREYGQRRAGQSGTALTVKDNDRLTGIDLSLGRGSAILGTVVDEHGEPLEGVKLTALQLRSLDARTVATATRSVSTDDRGQYRLPTLLAGRYLVSASDDATLAAQRVSSGYAPLYYPGVSGASEAATIALDGEHDQMGADLVFHPVRAVQVSGSVMSSTGVPPSAVLLMPSQRSSGIQVEPRSGEIRADGTFTIANVSPGDYVLQTVSRPQAASPEFGMQYLTVTDTAPAPVLIKLRPMSIVTGRIRIEGQGAEPSDFLVAPFPTDFDRSFAIGGGFPSSMGADGSFSMGQVTGPRRLTLLSGPKGWYLKSATLNGTDVADEPYDFGLEGQTYADLEIVVSSQGASVHGEVSDRSGGRVRDYAVIVYPTDRNLWFRNSRHVKFTRADQEGRFAVEGLAPGSYFVAALDEVDGNAAFGEWQDPVFLERLESSARRMELTEAERLSITLPLSSR